MVKLKGSIISKSTTIESSDINASNRGSNKTFFFDYILSESKSKIFENENTIIIVYGDVNYKCKNIVFLEDKALNTLSLDLLASLYQKQGVKILSRLDGNYIITIHDKNKDKVYLARDYFGKWPIYYYQNNIGFFFSSSLKSLEQNTDFDFTISKETLSLYFQLTYIPSPYCIYDNVYKLEPNHYLEFDCEEFNYTIKEINQSANFYNKDYSFNDAKKIVHDRVFDCVKNNIHTENDTGAFLSGGVDSSIVSLCYSKLSSSPINTFSLGFENKKYDETNESRIVANLIGSKHHEFILSPQDIVHDIDKVITNFEEPFADSSALPSYFISSKASKEVQRVLTGDGGDEVFGGYNKYYMGKLNRNYIRFLHPNIHNIILELSNTLLTQKSDKRGVVYKINRLLKSIDYEGNFYYNIISLGFQKEELKDLLLYSVNTEKSFDYYKNKMSGKSHTIHDFRQIDKMISLEGDMIVKVSKTSDLAKIESHSPMLSKDLWLFSNSLPESFLMKGWNKKYILKEAFKEYFPKGFFESPKKGFGVPVGDWLRKELKEELMYYSNKRLLKEQGLFNVDYVYKMVNNHINSIEDNTFKIWSFYCFQKWYFKKL